MGTGAKQIQRTAYTILTIKKKNQHTKLTIYANILNVYNNT